MRVEALCSVARYIHLNPVRAGLVDRPEDWEFSDFSAIRGQGVLHHALRTAEGRLDHGGDYVTFVQEGVENIKALRRFLFEMEAKDRRPRRPSNED